MIGGDPDFHFTAYFHIVYCKFRMILGTHFPCQTSIKVRSIVKIAVICKITLYVDIRYDIIYSETSIDPACQSRRVFTCPVYGPP